MDDEAFDDELEAYLNGVFPNEEMADCQVVWVEGNPAFGVLHMERKHGVSKEEVEEVLFETPPEVETKRHPDHRERTLFWGATREGRWLFIACDDWTENHCRHLKPITAFEPEEGREYWDNYE
jgi:uncharacterized DUF497 family protein